MKSGWLPAPLHLWASFRRLSYLDSRDLRGIANGLRALARLHVESCHRQTFETWLADHHQTQTAVERFWHVVLVSALSETLDRIDVQAARKVFVDAFLANRSGWKVQIPVVPLDDLYGTRVIEWLRRRRAEVRLQAGVKRVLLDGATASGVELRTGERLFADHVIVAVPHHLVLSLLPEPLRSNAHISAVSRLESAPITSVHLWFDRPSTTLPHAVFVSRLSQWMFNRSQLQSSAERGNGTLSGMRDGQYREFYYQVVISASRNLEGRTHQQTIEDVVDELSSVWPETKSARLIHSRLVTEHKAVFSTKPGADDLRPAQQSPVRNLQLAGDWTKTGWPATMEGAVRSGFLAAENVLSQLGCDEKLMAPDLAVAPLSKLLLGL